jgi:hypothetical protein
MNDDLPPLGDDLLIGAERIARAVYGNADTASVRSVRRNVLGLSLFKHGALIAAFRSTLRRELGEIESRARRARPQASTSASEKAA